MADLQHPHDPQLVRQVHWKFEGLISKCTVRAHTQRLR